MPRKSATAADELLTLPELAAELRLKPNTLYQWRVRGRGPQGFRAGGAVRYSRSEVRRWLAGQGDTRAA